MLLCAAMKTPKPFHFVFAFGVVGSLALFATLGVGCGVSAGDECESGADCGDLYCELPSPDATTGTCEELPASCTGDACDCAELQDSCANGYACVSVNGAATFNCL